MVTIIYQDVKCKFNYKNNIGNKDKKVQVIKFKM